MGKDSSIEWTDHTFNPWRGCTKVSEGCKHCYAEVLSKRNPKTLGEWGPKGKRVIAAELYWKLPLKWNNEARASGVRRRVFCASLADVFEDNWQVHIARQRLWGIIEDTEDLDWLLLTKRPENVMHLVPESWHDAELGGFPHNVWIGTSVENQAAADERIPHLLRVPARVRFLSCEPLLGPVDIWPWLGPAEDDESCVNWVIVGGESGHGARPMHPDWARSLRDQCQAAGVAYFFKQWGEYAPAPWDNPKPALAVCADGTHVVAQIGHVLGFREADEVCMERMGKGAAGRLLDGREWSEFPQEPR
jgi:protein gp37